MFRIHRTDKNVIFCPTEMVVQEHSQHCIQCEQVQCMCLTHRCTSLQNDVYITHAKWYTNSLANSCNHCSWTQSSFVIARKWSNILCMVWQKLGHKAIYPFLCGSCEIFATLFSSHCRWKYSVWILLILSWILCWWARPTSSLETVSPPSQLLSRGRETRTNCRLSFSDLMISSATLKQKEQNSKGF